MSAFLGRLQSAGVVFALFCAAAAASPGDAQGDYSHTIAVNVSGNQAVVQLQLPRAVYLEARTADLRDVRLFDATGTALPFALFEPFNQAQEHKSMAPVAVFPMQAPAGVASPLPEGLQIRTDEHGAVISLSARQGRSASDTLASLLLDLHGAMPTAQSSAPGPVSAFALSLPQDMSSYNARLAIDTSDDLQDWEPIVETSVSWLVNSQGASVRKDRIEFAPRSFRFARIRWLEGKPIEFAAIAAERVARTRASVQRESVVLQPKPGSTGQDLLYDAPIAVPVESLGLDLQSQNIVLPALVGQYRKITGRGPGSVTSVQLQPVITATFFQLIQNGQRRVSGDIAIGTTHASQWVVRPQAVIAERPGLRLRWTPAHMIFVAGGKGPYTLAFGGTGAQTSQVPVMQVAPGFTARELAMVEQARAGEPVRRSSGRDGANEEGQRDGPLNRSIWLWVLLVGGVAALGAMAWKLARQLKDVDPHQPPA